MHAYVHAYVIHVTCTSTCTVDLVDSPTYMSSSFPHNLSPNYPSSRLSSLLSPLWQPGQQTTGWNTQRSTLAHEKRNVGIHVHVCMCTWVQGDTHVKVITMNALIYSTYSYSLPLRTCTYAGNVHYRMGAIIGLTPWHLNMHTAYSTRS